MNRKDLPQQVKNAYLGGGLIFGARVLYAVTKDGNMKAGPDDWLICGVKGELYPCGPDVFSATYEIVK